jgi:hypothetical protein
MLHVMVNLFDLPDVEFVMSFGDNFVCDRCGFPGHRMQPSQASLMA